MITFTISIGSVVIGFLLGMAISFLVVWLSEAEMAKDDRWDVGFSQGWNEGCKYGKQCKDGET